MRIGWLAARGEGPSSTCRPRPGGPTPGRRGTSRGAQAPTAARLCTEAAGTGGFRQTHRQTCNLWINPVDLTNPCSSSRRHGLSGSFQQFGATPLGPSRWPPASREDDSGGGGANGACELRRACRLEACWGWTVSSELCKAHGPDPAARAALPSRRPNAPEYRPHPPSHPESPARGEAPQGRAPCLILI